MPNTGLLPTRTAISTSWRGSLKQARSRYETLALSCSGNHDIDSGRPTPSDRALIKCPSHDSISISPNRLEEFYKNFAVDPVEPEYSVRMDNHGLFPDRYFVCGFKHGVLIAGFWQRWLRVGRRRKFHVAVRALVCKCLF